MAYQPNDGDMTLFRNDSDNEKAPKWRGYIIIDGQVLGYAVWRSEFKDGTPFLSGKPDAQEAAYQAKKLDMDVHPLCDDDRVERRRVRREDDDDRRSSRGRSRDDDDDRGSRRSARRDDRDDDRRSYSRRDDDRRDDRRSERRQERREDRGERRGGGRQSSFLDDGEDDHVRARRADPKPSLTTRMRTGEPFTDDFNDPMPPFGDEDFPGDRGTMGYGRTPNVDLSNEIPF